MAGEAEMSLIAGMLIGAALSSGHKKAANTTGGTEFIRAFSDRGCAQPSLVNVAMISSIQEDDNLLRIYFGNDNFNFRCETLETFLKSLEPKGKK